MFKIFLCESATELGFNLSPQKNGTSGSPRPGSVPGKGWVGTGNLDQDGPRRAGSRNSRSGPANQRRKRYPLLLRVHDAPSPHSTPLPRRHSVSRPMAPTPPHSRLVSPCRDPWAALLGAGPEPTRNDPHPCSLVSPTTLGSLVPSPGDPSVDGDFTIVPWTSPVPRVHDGTLVVGKRCWLGCGVPRVPSGRQHRWVR